MSAASSSSTHQASPFAYDDRVHSRRKVFRIILIGLGLGTLVSWGILRYTMRPPYPFMAGSSLLYVQLNPADSGEAWLTYATREPVGRLIDHAGLEFGPSVIPDTLVAVTKETPGAYPGHVIGADGKPNETYWLKTAATFRRGQVQVDVGHCFAEYVDAGIEGRVPMWLKEHSMISIRRRANAADRFHAALFGLRYPGLRSSDAEMFASRENQHLTIASLRQQALAEREARIAADPALSTTIRILGLRSAMPWLRKR